MTQSSKICLNFETGEELKNIFISVDSDFLLRTSNKKEFPAFVDFDFKDKSKDSDPIFKKYPLLLELQKKLGFDVYEKYVVYSNPENCIVKYFTRKDKSEWLESSCKKNMIQCSIKFYDMNFYLDGVQELFKYYRGKENKFEEVREILGI